MRVSNKFQTSQNLIKLPNDFKVVKVDFKSLKDNTVRRLCRDIETQLGLDPVVIKENDRIDMEEYLVKILNDELWDTRDLKTSIVVLTNKGGLLGGRIFTQADFHKRIIDYKQFADNYPIFDDTTTVKQLETGGGVPGSLKRERDQTFTFDPQTKKPDLESFGEIQAIWAEQESNYKRQIEDLKSKKDSALEQNNLLAETASNINKKLEEKIAMLEANNSETHSKYEKMVDSLKDRINELEVSKMEQDQDESLVQDAYENEMASLMQTNEDLRSQIEEQSRKNNEQQEQPARVMGLLDDLFGNDTDKKLEYAEKLQTEVSWKQGTLNQLGMSRWDPDTTSFLDYLISLRTVFTETMTVKKCINLLFSGLPSKYQYLRAVIGRHPQYDPKNYWTVEKILVIMIIGGKEKIFTEFVNLQKTDKETFLQFYQKACDYYLFSYSNADQMSFEKMEKDPIAFKLIKDKMVKAYPNRYVPEFKRQLEGKSSLNDIFVAILFMKDQYTDLAETNDDYSKNEINVLKQRKDGWKKSVKCFNCGRRGHIKKNCRQNNDWKKTKKSEGRK